MAREKSKHQVKGSDPGSKARMSHLDDDYARVKELDEKLRRLAEMSRTSAETFIADDAKATPTTTDNDAVDKEAASLTQEAATKKLASTSVQTSLTDLTNLGKRPGLNLWRIFYLRTSFSNVIATICLKSKNQLTQRHLKFFLILARGLYF